MNAFFAAVEVLDDPSLRGKPVIVGGLGPRGVVATASYEARVFGVGSAQPMIRARRLCPHGVFIPGRYARYVEVSGQVHEVFRSFTPVVEGLGLDEAFLDVTGALGLFGPEPMTLGRTLRARMLEATGLRCSVGLAPSKLLAKLASETAKPRIEGRRVRPGPGVFEVEPGGELAYLHPKPAQALWGVGPATLARLERIGVVTVGDLARIEASVLVGLLGEAHGRHLHRLSQADDDRPVEVDRPLKSVGHEETFATDRTDRNGLETDLFRMAEAVGRRLRDGGRAGRTVQVKVRFGDFRTITRSHTVPEPIDTGLDIVRVARDLLDQVDLGPGLRLLGVSVSGFEPGAGRQLSFDLDAPGDDRPAGQADAGPQKATTATVDAIRERFGDAAIGPARLVDRAPKRPGEQQWGPNRVNPS